MSNPSFMIFLVISIALKVNFSIAGKSGGRTGYPCLFIFYPLSHVAFHRKLMWRLSQ